MAQMVPCKGPQTIPVAIHIFRTEEQVVDNKLFNTIHPTSGTRKIISVKCKPFIINGLRKMPQVNSPGAFCIMRCK